MYERGTRECLPARWPGRTEPGSPCSVAVASTDFYPTILEAARLSLMDLLEGGSELERYRVDYGAVTR